MDSLLYESVCCGICRPRKLSCILFLIISVKAFSSLFVFHHSSRIISLFLLFLLILRLRSTRAPNPHEQRNNDTEHEPDNRSHDHQKHRGIFSITDNVIEIFQHVFQMFVIFRHGLELQSELLHLNVERRGRGRDGIVGGGFVPSRGEFVQCIDVPGSLVAVHFSIGKVFERGIGLYLEAIGYLRFFRGVDFGDDDAILCVFLLELLIELLPDGRQCLAMTTPGRVELNKPLSCSLARRSLSLVLEGDVGQIDHCRARR
mmetsp:Transcript_33366/g.70132  ORF Transcript_33366/g.70132 Transcript_33366/m.70132 type:complete len:259 (-) Transcript_33366:172-948(-)